MSVPRIIILVAILIVIPITRLARSESPEPTWESAVSTMERELERLNALIVEHFAKTKVPAQQILFSIFTMETHLHLLKRMHHQSAPNISCMNATIKTLDLRGSHIEHANFMNTKIEQAFFGSADLRNANFSNAKFSCGD